MTVAVVSLIVSNVTLLVLVVSERLGRERLIGHVMASSPAETAMLERAARRPRSKRRLPDSIPDFNPLEAP